MAAFLRDLRDALTRRDLWIFPSAVAFHLLACAVPFLLVLFAAFGHVVSREEAYRTVTRMVAERLPAAAPAIDDVLRGAARASRTAGAVGLATLLMTAMGLMRTLRAALNHAFAVEELHHPLKARLYDLLLIGLLGEAVLLAAVGLWGVLALPLPFPGAIRLGLRAAAWAFNLALIYGLYLLLPDRRPSQRTALTAAAAFAVLWEAARALMGWYLGHAFRNYSLVWGAAAAMVAAGVWLYYSAVLFIFCAAVGSACDRGASKMR